MYWHDFEQKNDFHILLLVGEYKIISGKRHSNVQKTKQEIMSRYAVVPGRADTRGYCGLFAPYTTVTFSGESIETEKPFGTPFDQRPGHWSQVAKRKRQKLSAQGAASASPSAATKLSATETAAKEARARRIAKRNGPNGRRIARKCKKSRTDSGQMTHR